MIFYYHPILGLFLMFGLGLWMSYEEYVPEEGASKIRSLDKRLNKNEAASPEKQTEGVGMGQDQSSIKGVGGAVNRRTGLIRGDSFTAPPGPGFQFVECPDETRDEETDPCRGCAGWSGPGGDHCGALWKVIPVEEEDSGALLPLDRPLDPTTRCPNCEAELENRKCKLICTNPGCGFLISCSET